MNLVSLEVATSGHERPETGAGHGAGDDLGRRGEPGRDTDPTTPEAPDAAETVNHVLELPGGLLVDVLA